MKKKLLSNNLPYRDQLDKIIELYLTKSSNIDMNITKAKRDIFIIFNKIAEHNWVNGYTSAMLDMKKENEKFN